MLHHLFLSLWQKLPFFFWCCFFSPFNAGFAAGGLRRLRLCCRDEMLSRRLCKLLSTSNWALWNSGGPREAEAACLNAPSPPARAGLCCCLAPSHDWAHPSKETGIWSPSKPWCELWMGFSVVFGEQKLCSQTPLDGFLLLLLPLAEFSVHCEHFVLNFLCIWSTRRWMW